jgi:hypothetical protein
MPRWKLLTLRYWAFVGGLVTPLLLSAVYAAVVLNDAETPTLAWYPVAILLPPLLVVGGVLSYMLRRPESAAARFALGLAIGSALFLIGQTGAIRF